MRTIAIQAAEAGTKVLQEMYGRVGQISHKGDVDLVTEADCASEKAIVEAIRKIFPRHDILAEEGNYGSRQSDYCWIIDPLDGTTNYAHGFPWFGISIALEVAGEVRLGIVSNPCLGELFIAEKGGGTTLNDRPVRVSSVTSLDHALLATGFPYDRKTSNANNYDHFLNFQQQAQACRRPGAASLDLASAACGRFDGFWEMKLQPWDVAAGKLLVEEAGGQVTDFAGAGCDIYGAEIVASNGALHQQMLAVLAQGGRP